MFIELKSHSMEGAPSTQRILVDQVKARPIYLHLAHIPETFSIHVPVPLLKNIVIFPESTTSSGSSHHIYTTWCVKKSYLYHLKSMPARFRLPNPGKKTVNMHMLLVIFYTSTRSPFNLLTSRKKRSSLSNLSL